MEMERWITLIGLLSIFGVGTSLECYFCIDQRNNKDKCIKSTKQCESFQDTCISHVRWAGLGLECYRCSNEDDNDGDCTSETRECDQFQDACTSYIRWAVPPYWTPRGDREYYISKDCDTRQGCERRQAALKTHCKRDWYNDWACVECCTGDLCNYWVTKIDRYGRLTSMGSETAQISTMSILFCTVGSLFIFHHQL